jgi:hypothetical protein
MGLCPKDSGAETDAHRDRALVEAPRLFTSGKPQRPQEMRL